MDSISNVNLDKIDSEINCYLNDIKTVFNDDLSQFKPNEIKVDPKDILELCKLAEKAV